METNGVAISQSNVNFILPTKTFQQYFITWWHENTKNTKSTTNLQNNDNDNIDGSSKQGHNLNSTEELKLSVSRRIIMQQTILF